MPADVFLKLEGIAGESQDANHKNEIDVESFTWGLTQIGSQLQGGRTSRASFQDFSFTMRANKASPLLFLSSASGATIRAATLTVRDAGESRLEYLRIKLSDVLVSSYEQGGTADDDRPVDQVSLNFTKIEVEYTPQRPDGTADSPVKAGWDLKANQKI